MQNLFISNVPGSREPLYLAGAKLERPYPGTQIGDMQALNITALSYLDSMPFGIVVCPDVVPAETPWELLRYIEDDLAELKGRGESLADPDGSSDTASS
jgi:diacylglycerol O-acyltransferase